MPHAAANPWADRRLGVVMFLDMVGYSAHMAKNEKHAMAKVAALEAVLRAEVPACGGTIVKFLGDGTMVEFPTAVAAVSCSQRVLAAIREHNVPAPPAERFNVRIGLHLGDVIEKGQDLFGDTVNIAARIQPYADPGGIAMSKTVWLSVRNQLPLKGVGAYLRPRKLKNIPDRVRIYLVPPPGTPRLPWIIRRRYPVRLTGVAALALAGVSGWLAWDRFGARPNDRIALLDVRPSQIAPVSRKVQHMFSAAQTETGLSPVVFARKVQDEIELRAAALSGVRWVEHGSLAEAVRAAGADPGRAETVEAAAPKVARATGLRRYVTALLEPKGFDAWRLKLKLVGAGDGSLEASFEVAGNTAPELAEAAVAGLAKALAARAPSATALK